MKSPSFASIAFLAMAFAVVGLIGLFATYGAPLTYERALAREAALDDAAAAALGPDPASAIAALRPRLGESADAILPIPPGADLAAIETKIAHERAAMLDRFRQEADATTTRLRWLIVLITIMGAAFGAVMLSVSGREVRPAAAPRA